ncbi:hypothetical protein UFOVP806_41 [uncultured Caudovirales phage]|uniref:Uncharacterized protein n=1 Tax=uncultured Caudovirales phage TaxID=2100421 RepID=A0A6J5P172_9CAUD|nr:hypothetical protein UFOVP806_41 [uncultured Caudovirales phage]
MCGGGSSKAAQNAAQESQRQFNFQQEQQRLAEQREAQRQQKLREGMSQVNAMYDKYGQSYFDNISNNYVTQFANPQIAQQEQRDATRAKFGLARGGILQSSAAAQELANLAQVYGQTRLDAASRGQQMAESRRADIENNRRSTLNALQASENPDIAIASATRAQDAFTVSPAAVAITDLLGNAANMAQRDYMAAQAGGNSGGVFSPFFGRNQGNVAGGQGTTKVLQY